MNTTPLPDGDDHTMPMPARPTGDRPPPATLPTIPGVVLGGEIARGGMGVVYAGVQEYLDRKVAVKVLAAHLQSPEFVQRFRREAQILAGLSHRHLVACHGAGITAEGHCFMVMEFIDGPTLRRHCDAHGALDELDAIRLVRDLAQVLQHAHDAGIIHRDVKPENVLLHRDERHGGPFPFVPKLVDLGLARHTTVDHQMTAPGVVMGTASTMAPEQFDDPDHVDYRADIYGLGCVAFHALAGRPAFANGNLTSLLQTKAEPLGPDPAAFNPRVSAPVAAFVRGMMAHNPAERPASYAKIIDTCVDLIGSTGQTTETLTTRDESARAPRRSPWLLVALFVVAAAVVGAWLASRPTAPPVPGPGPEPAPPVEVPRPDPQAGPPQPEPGPGAEQDQPAATSVIDLFGQDLVALGWTCTQPEEQKGKAFAPYEEGTVNARCPKGEARCSHGLPRAFALDGTIVSDPNWGAGRAAAAGIELAFPDMPTLCLWVEDGGSGLRVSLGTRKGGAWPPTVLKHEQQEQSLLLADARQVEFHVQLSAKGLEVVLDSGGRGLLVKLPVPAGDCQLAAFVRDGQARFSAFRLRQ